MPDEHADRIRAAAPGDAVRLADDLVLFRVDKARFRYGQGYALLRDDATVLVDAVHDQTRAALEAVLEGAAPVAALILTHSDLLGQAWGSVADLEAALGAPVVIHHADRRGTSARPVTCDEQAPSDADRLLADLGVTPHPVPGHTPGSTVFVTREGHAFTGDAAVGPTYGDRTGPGLSEWSHPPVSRRDWPAFEAGWRAVAGPARTLLPLHGRPAFGGLDGALLDALRDGSDGSSALEAFGRGVLDPANTMRA